LVNVECALLLLEKIYGCHHQEDRRETEVNVAFETMVSIKEVVGRDELTYY
jgi:hypothetical protein